jgi:hypothetical protein
MSIGSKRLKRDTLLFVEGQTQSPEEPLIEMKYRKKHDSQVFLLLKIINRQVEE